MKHLVLFWVFAGAYALSDEVLDLIKQDIARVGGICKTETAVSQDDLNTLMKLQVPTSKEGKCFIACFNKNVGFQDANGKVDKAAALDIIDALKEDDLEYHAKMAQVIEKCFTEAMNADDECDTGANLLTCSSKAEAELGLNSAILL